MPCQNLNVAVIESAPMNALVDAKMMNLAIRIDGLPKMANGGHRNWGADASDKKKWRMKVARELVGLGPTVPFKKIKVIFTRHSAVEPDDDGNAHGFKPIRDALVKLGFVVDDKPSNMEAHYRWQKAPKTKGFITIEIEGIEP